jgi:transcriptional regulator with GAF, ATPase, and Fis domain
MMGMSLETSADMSSDLTATERALVEATLALSERLEVADTCDALLGVIERLFEARSTWILLHDASTDELVTTAYRGPGADAFANARIPCDRGIVGLAFRRREPVFVPDAQHEGRWFDAARVHQSELLAVITMPLVVKSQAIGIVGLQSPRFSAAVPPTSHDLARLRAIAAIAGAELRNARLHEAIEADRVRLERLLRERRALRGEVTDLRKQVREAQSLDPAVGQSPVFRRVLAEVELVARADSTVLLVGETGTGKELIARALHDQSRRASRPFIAVNCAALPEALVESELFGYEKGAFTGAMARKPGKFELANHGTLFLDEVGDLPGQAQAKLLRVLQEREVQRVGGTRAEPINVRLVAATNQDLSAGVQAGSFRTDLFYRLNVFPIRLPALRERPDDIAPLAEHFLGRFADRQHKRVPRLTREALDRLTAYDWPGNVRELQNVVERALILCRDGVIGPDLISLQPPRERADTPPREPAPSEDRVPGRAGNVIRFCDAERHAILRALELAGWRISGRAGAADILGLKATTLHAKMKKLGIRRPSALTSRDDHYSRA